MQDAAFSRGLLRAADTLTCPLTLQRAAGDPHARPRIRGGTICRADVHPVTRLSLRIVALGPWSRLPV